MTDRLVYMAWSQHYFESKGVTVTLLGQGSYTDENLYAKTQR